MLPPGRRAEPPGPGEASGVVDLGTATTWAASAHGPAGEAPRGVWQPFQGTLTNLASSLRSTAHVVGAEIPEIAFLHSEEEPISDQSSSGDVQPQSSPTVKPPGPNVFLSGPSLSYLTIRRGLTEYSVLRNTIVEFQRIIL